MLSLSHVNFSKRSEVTTCSWYNLQILQSILFDIVCQVLTEIIFFSLKIEMKRQYRWNSCQDLLCSFQLFRIRLKLATGPIGGSFSSIDLIKHKFAEIFFS